MKNGVKIQLVLRACEQREHFQHSKYTQGPREQILEQTLHTDNSIKEMD